MSSIDEDDETQRRQATLFGDDEDLEDYAGEEQPQASSSGDEEQTQGKKGQGQKPRKRRRAVGEEEARQREADAQFLEDDLVQDGSDDDNQQERVYHPEAIEEDEIMAILKGGKRKRKQDDPERDNHMVETFCRQMEVAAEMDVQEHDQGRMAMAKIRMIPQVEKFCYSLNYREYLIKHRVTSGMKSWLMPYPDGTLPHVRVRSVILKALEKLDLDTADDEHRSMLKETDVGKYVLFYSRLTDETSENKRLANQIVQKWTKPLLSQQSDDLARRQRDEQRYREKRSKQTNAEKPSSAGKQQPLRPGDAGYRVHASIPKASKLDYVNMPESFVEDKPELASERHDPLARKVRELNRKKGAAAR